MRRTLWGIASVLLLAGGAALWAPRWFDPVDDSLARVRAAGVLRVGYAVEAPYALVDAEGRVTGQSPELARLVATQAGLPGIQWVQTSFDQLIPQLQARRFDMIAAGMFITADRAQRVRFSEPTERVAAGLLQRGDSRLPDDLRALADQPQWRLAVLADSVEQQMARQAGVANERLLVVRDPIEGREVVAHGMAHGLMLSLPTVRQLAGPGPLKARALSRAAAPGWVAFEFHRDDEGLQQRWNRAQAQVVGSDAHRALMQRFGFAADDLPGSVTLAQLLAAS